LLYAIGRRLVRPWASLVIAFVSVVGSSLISTLGAALWSLNFTTLIIALALWILVRWEETIQILTPDDSRGYYGAGSSSGQAYLLGLLFFLAFLSRPSSVAFIAPALVLVFWRTSPSGRRVNLTRSRTGSLFWKVAIAALAPLILFAGWSLAEYGSWFPPYYTPARLQGTGQPLWIGIAGNLFSPSRGLLVYSPFFLLLLVAVFLFWRELRRLPLFWLCVAWFAAQLLLVSRAVIWWGGNSFGPRLLTDALPGLVLLLFLTWREVERASTRRSLGRAAAALFLGLGFVAFLIHLGGLYRGATGRWSLLALYGPTARTGLGGDYFDWRKAQILADNEMICSLELENLLAYLPMDTTLAPYHTGDPIGPLADRIIPVDVPGALSRAGTAPRATEEPVPAGKFAATESVFMPLIRRSANEALFAGWEPPGQDAVQRLTVCPTATIAFLRAPSEQSSGQGEVLSGVLDATLDRALGADPAVLKPAEVQDGEARTGGGTTELTIRGATFGPQRMEVSLNDVPLGTIAWPGDEAEMSLPFPTDLLRPGELNRLSFHFPDAHTLIPSLDYYRFYLNDRHLAFALQEMRLLSPGASMPPAPAPPPSPYPR
jgi:hypothetical protein